MKKLLIAAAIATAFVAGPASAQAYLGAGAGAGEASNGSSANGRTLGLSVKYAF